MRLCSVFFACAMALSLPLTALGAPEPDTGNQDFKVTYAGYPWSWRSTYSVERSDGSRWHAQRNNLTGALGFKYHLCDADGHGLGTLTSRWKDPIAVRPSTANLEYRNASGDRSGRLRGRFWNMQLLRLDLYDGRDIQAGVVQCSAVHWLTCEVKTDPEAILPVATMVHTSWNVWEVTVHRDGLVDQTLMELAPLYLHDYARAVIYYRTVLHGTNLSFIP